MLKNEIRVLLNFKTKSKLENEMNKFLWREYSKRWKIYKVIFQGGKTNATMMCFSTNNYENLGHYKQLIAFVEMNPGIYQKVEQV